MVVPLPMIVAEDDGVHVGWLEIICPCVITTPFALGHQLGSMMIEETNQTRKRKKDKTNKQNT